MTRVTTGAVRDARPPEHLVRVMNPAVRALLRSPLGRRIGALAIVDHHGRRTGEPRHVVTAWHELDGRGFVVTPAAWRANFTGGAPARVRHEGRTQAMTGTLVDDPIEVAATLQRMFDAVRTFAARLMAEYDVRAPSVRAQTATLSGGNQQKAVVAVDEHHAIDAADVIAVRRAIVWFEPEARPRT